MFNSQKIAFWQALIVTLLILGLGIIFGIILENWRVGRVDSFYQKSDLDMMDIRLQSEIYSSNFYSCDKAVEENIKFADRIYEEAKLLERYESASELRSDLKLRHKKYDFLRANLILNSNRIRKKCNSTYYEVVYIYKYNTKDVNVQARQNVFSKLLSELKERKGSEILLIPIAGDNDLSSVNLLMSMYNITQEDLPIIIINEKIKIKELESIEELLKNFN